MMFYTQLFTSKRAPLAKVWLAAHWESKLTKAHVFECNLENTIRELLSTEMTIGLRTTGHLLLGVVRIYSKKAKYLLADCNDALVKIKMAFRPGQTDLPADGLEATFKAITLIEDFTDFDTQLPHPSDIDVVDRFSLNQSRTEEITLKEDLGFLILPDVGKDSHGHQNVLLDMNFQSLAQHEDAFGDEGNECDLLDFLANTSDPDWMSQEPQSVNLESSTSHRQQDPDRQDDQMEADTSTVNITTLLSNEEGAFALKPVPLTPNSEKKRGKGNIKRKLIVDQTKELSNKVIRQQLDDCSDLIGSMIMAPPTRQLMQWKENGSADKLLAQPCSTVTNPQIKELFARSIFQVKYGVEEPEASRHNGQEIQMGMSSFTTENVSVLDSSEGQEKTHNTELTDLDHMIDNQSEDYSEQVENRSEFTHPELPSEDSMFVHQSHMEQDSLSTSIHTQSMLDSQDFEERMMTRRAQKLLNILKSQSSSESPFSLAALCKGMTRTQAATTFLSLIILKKQHLLNLHQNMPFEDILVTPGPNYES